MTYKLIKIGALVSTLLFLAVLAYARLDSNYKRVCVDQLSNGYILRYGTTDDNFYGTQPNRLAYDAQSAAAEVWQYLSGKPIQTDWGR